MSRSSSRGARRPLASALTTDPEFDLPLDELPDDADRIPDSDEEDRIAAEADDSAPSE